MTIRIDRIERCEVDGHFSWFMRMKGLRGKGVYRRLLTGVEGHGLPTAERELDAFTELLTADRFHTHEGLNAKQVAHRMAARLVCIGWGPEFHDDRHSITDGDPKAPIVNTGGEASP